MKLSILICHLNSRKKLLERLMAVLQPQVDAANGEVEVLVEADDGKISTGAKRNILLDRARGEFVCCHDDDDLPSPEYVPKILSAIDSNPSVDCIGMEGLIYQNGTPKKFIHSLQHRSWSETKQAYLRNPNHLNPVRRALALIVRFPEITVGEDFNFSMRLLPLLKTETYISGPIYHYYP